MLRRWSLWLLGCGLLSEAATNGMTVTLTSSVPAPALLGTPVTFIASVSDASSPHIWFRFRVRSAGGEFRVIKDYGPVNTLDWTASRHEGVYEIETVARDVDTGEQDVGFLLFQFLPLATGSVPVVTPTANSLVFMYSAPACESQSRMRVEFSVSGGTVQHTPYEPCQPGLTMNFYLAGLRADSTITAHHVIDTGSAFVPGPDVSFTSGSVPSGLYNQTTVIANQGPVTQTVLLGAPIDGRPVASDLAGNVVWYGPDDLTFVTRPDRGGAFWAIVQGEGDETDQVVRKFDLTGMTLQETNAARVNEQLAAMGRRTVASFHHEARPIRGGRVAVLAAVEQIMTDVQGPGPVDILGDMIVVLDKDMNVVWTWDTFDYLDVHRAAVLGETCPIACPPLRLSQTANDWTHGNAIQETPDGNLLFSSRHQDWLIKIAYDDGKRDGEILWRLGRDGDFQFDWAEEFPWFSHQHDANFDSADPSKLHLFDNGNTRLLTTGTGNSRGQVLQIDEANRTVSRVLSADLGLYSFALGSAERLQNGNYHFNAGWVFENGTGAAYSCEVRPDGSIVYQARHDAPLYRTFRMTDMYSPR